MSSLRTLPLTLLFLTLFLGISGCNNDKQKEASPLSAVVVVIYSPNGLGDMSYDDAIYKALRVSQKKYGFRMQTIVPQSIDEVKIHINQWLEYYKNNDSRQLLILAGDSYESIAREYASQLPDDNKGSVILFESSVTDLPVYTFILPFYGASYEAGYLASQINSVEKPLIVIANGSPILANATKGFEQGFNSVKPHKVDVDTLSQDETGYYMADWLYIRSSSYDQNYQFIYPLVGGSIQGLVRYCTNVGANYLYAGIDVDMNDLMSNNIPFSVVKHVDVVISQYIDNWLNGIKLPRHKSYGLSSAMVEVIVSPYYNESEALKRKLTEIHPLAIEKEKAYGTIPNQ